MRKKKFKKSQKFQQLKKSLKQKVFFSSKNRKILMKKKKCRKNAILLFLPIEDISL